MLYVKAETYLSPNATKLSKYLIQREWESSVRILFSGVAKTTALAAKSAKVRNCILRSLEACRWEVEKQQYQNKQLGNAEQQKKGADTYLPYITSPKYHHTIMKALIPQHSSGSTFKISSRTRIRGAHPCRECKPRLARLQILD